MSKIITLFLFYFLFFFNPLSALNSNDIPPALQEWKAWVLDEVKDRDCPLNIQTKQRECTYPTAIEVEVLENSLSFKMMVAVFKEQERVLLPFAYQNWVQDVVVDGKRKEVLGSTEAVVFLDEGEHIVEGKLFYKEMPKYLQLPSKMALVSLLREGKKVVKPKVDSTSRLWLTENQESSSSKGSLAVSIYRKLIDGHPMKMQTYLHFRVSGKMRSVLLDGIVLEGFSPSALSGNLDAKITKDKKLEVQVKAGEWVVNIDSFSAQNLFELELPKHSFNYANEETLSLQTNASYRTIEVLNAQSIDPSQSNIPKEWKQLPLYLLEKDKALKIKELYKSAKQQQQNDFVLSRELWLDFDGKGYSIKDFIKADISKVKRLESKGVLELGSVSINGKPMLINTLKDSPQKGVELREEHLEIEASSRYEKSSSILPINGWSEKFNRVTTRLNLPPGWKVFASFGSDSQSSKSWIKKWNLMDIFLLLLLSIAIYQLFGLKWSLPATLFLAFLWHEDGAPTIVWLWILVLVALIRVLGEGKIKKGLQVVFAFSMIFVVLNVLLFSVYEVRTTLYPQLEKRAYVSAASFSDKSDIYEEKAIAYEETDSIISHSRAYPTIKKISNYATRENKMMPQKKQILLQNKIDPNAIVQTGEGTPTWRWTQHSFYWQSTVGLDENLELWLISPAVTKLLNILNIVGMFFLLWMFLQGFLKTTLDGLKEKMFQTQSLKAFFFIGLLAWTPQNIHANEIPSNELLQELKTKLLETPACLPECATIEQVELGVENDKLLVTMRISAGTDVSVPILGNRNSWLPETVSVNDSNRSYLQLDKEGNLWVMLRKGVHSVSLSGSIKGLNKIMLSSQLPLHNLTLNKNPLWKINSDHKRYIELLNLDEASAKSREKTKSAIEPMVEITRTFYFGLRWYIETEVKLLNSIDQSYSLHYKLLKNESVLKKEIEVEDDEVVLHLSNTQRYYNWRSSLAITPELVLKASSQKQVTEKWKMDISSMWNMEYKGLDSDKQVAQNNLLMPTFRPWKEDALTLRLEPIKAVKGKSLTIESSHLTITQSQRYRDLTLTLNVQSSRAEQYVVELDNVEELSSVKIDGMDYYLKMNNSKLSIPLAGKAQTVVLKWKEELGTQTIYNFSKIDLNKASVNSEIALNLPRNRWILWTNGPLLGPAVLLWGVMLSVLIFALILGKFKGSPLKVRDWLLLGVGVSTSSVIIMLPIVAWIFLLRYKEQRGADLTGGWRNFVQVLIVLLTIIALGTFVGAVSVGLLGNPDMMIQGNNSYGFNLNWYSDRIGETLAQPTVVSVSMWYYRALMLLWAIWISFSLIKWLKWSWSVFSEGDMWVKSKKVKKVKVVEEKVKNE